MITRHEHSASQGCPLERICSLSAIIPSTPYQTFFLAEAHQRSENGSPAAVLCLVEDVTPGEEQSWHLCLWKYFFSFSALFCLFGFFPNLQSPSICLCRRINLWYALYMWHFVTFFACHPGGTALCTAHAVSITNNLLSLREYKESKKKWDVSATKTPIINPPIH